MRKLLIVLVSMLPLFGCASLEKHNATAHLVVTAATLKGIEQGWDVERVRAIVTTAKALTAGEEVTLDGLRLAITRELDKLELSPADRLLATALVQVISDELQARIGTGILKPEQRVQVNQVLQWVLDATAISGSDVTTAAVLTEYVIAKLEERA